MNYNSTFIYSGVNFIEYHNKLETKFLGKGEKNQASSEVDLVYPYKDKVIPIEIKSGAKAL